MPSEPPQDSITPLIRSVAFMQAQLSLLSGQLSSRLTSVPIIQ